MYTTRNTESNLGNLIADAMVWEWRNWTAPDGQRVRLAIQNSGGIRTNIEPGPVNLKELLTVLPFQHTFDVVGLKGRHIKLALRNSVEPCQGQERTGATDCNAGSGRFLQVSF